MMNIDRVLENADWCKQSWNLPAYKSKAFMEGVMIPLDEFRKLPVYKAAVARGLIVRDEWKGPSGGYC
jgi:hypothetical protein